MRMIAAGESVETTLGRHDERITNTDKKVSDLSGQLTWLVRLMVTTLLTSLGTLAAFLFKK
jgi:hypothetical protein